MSLHRQAKRDVNDIWDYIAHDSIEAADRVLNALNNATIKLAKSPGIGHWREELTGKRHRFFLVYFVSHHLPPRDQAAPNYPCSPCRTRCAEYSWPHA